MIQTLGPRPQPKPAALKKGQLFDSHGRVVGTEPPALFVPKAGKGTTLPEWLWREFKSGGYLHAYLEREKAQTGQRLRAVARANHKFEQNRKSDLRLKMVVPAREFLRWQQEDPHFWDDPSNLKSFQRDNPEVKAWKG